jgi:hypothetical protein
MALSFTSLTHDSSTTDGTTFNTASITPGANRLILCLDQGRKDTGTGAQSTITGCGLTWVQLATVILGTTRRINISRALGASPSTGQVTITYANSQEWSLWQVVEVDGVDTSGTNGSGAIVGSPVTDSSSSATTLSLTLPAFASANNAAFGFFVHTTNQVKTPGSGFTELVDFGLADVAGTGFQSEYKLNSTTVDASWATTSGALAIAIEIAAAAATGLLRHPGMDGGMRDMGGGFRG